MVDVVMDRELASGAFERQRSAFREWVGIDPATGARGAYPVAAGRYRLYVSLACPWCHRVAIVRELAGLGDETLPISYVAPFRDERGWEFTGERFAVAGASAGEGWTGSFLDDAHGWRWMAQAYRASEPEFDARVTVPVLWDGETERIVNNESSEIVRMLYGSGSLGGLGRRAGDEDGEKRPGGGGLELYPVALRGEIDALNERVYETINDGVYRAGFARTQEAYERAFVALFESFAWLERMLGERRYLAGARVTEADWRLFPTLVRFDEVYHVHFRCNRRRIVEYPNLWGYARELYQWPGVARTVAMDQIKRHYYTTHTELNPKGIIPLGPAPDWLEPHGRGSHAGR